jgi:hypothetical protein
VIEGQRPRSNMRKSHFLMEQHSLNTISHGSLDLGREGFATNVTLKKSLNRKPIA